MRIQIIIPSIFIILINFLSLQAQEKVQVFGTLDINNKYSFPTTDGADGQVLQTNGLGILDWVTPVLDDNDWTISGGNIYRQFGRVGIGTITPDEMLDIHGNIELEGPNRFISFKATGILTNGIRFYEGDTFRGGMFFNPQNEYIHLTNNFNNNGLALSLMNNYVGIGTTDPQDQLHIKAVTNSDLRLEANGSKYLRFYEAATQKATFGHNGTDLLMQNFETNGDIIFNVDGGDAEAIIETGGNFGIGTTNPQYKLDIFNGDATSAAIDAKIDVNIEDNTEAYLGLNGGSFAGVIINDDNAAIRAGLIYDYGFDDLAIFTSGNFRMYFKESGLIGINEPVPSAGLHIKQYGSQEEALALENDSNSSTWSYEIGTNDLFIYFNGVQRGTWNDADGVYTSSSDIRLKTDIVDLSSGTLDKLIQLTPKSYYFKDDNERQDKSIGFIAQEVELIFPDAVNPPESAENFYTLNYQEIGVLAVQSIKELNVKLTEQENTINEFKTQLIEKDREIESLKNQLENRIKKIETQLNIRNKE